MLPLLSRILDTKAEPVSVLYIAPLKALLNDLRERLETLLEPLALRVAVWHGDVSDARRRKIATEPPDILLATPESIEVLLSFANDARRALLRGVRTVVVDEAHVFFGDLRGTHLLAVIERLAQYAEHDLQRIALSATVGNPKDLAQWLRGSSQAQMRVCAVPKDPSRVERFEVRYAPRQVDILEYLAGLRAEKVVTFVPSRRDVETISRALLDRKERAWPHHSAISAASRRETEAAFRDTDRGVLVATSTFELGVDIGGLDRVVQVDAPSTVSAMAQRLGRTGRRPGTIASMTFLARKTETLLLALALLRLHAQGWIEPLEPPSKPYLVLVQQILANVIQTGGLPKTLLIERLSTNAAFTKIGAADVARIVEALFESGALQLLDERVQLAPKVERRFSFRNFGDLASVFTSDSTVDVVNRDQVVGFVQRWYLERVSRQTEPTFLLSGSPWAIKHWDQRKGIVEVVRAEHARAPVFLGGAMELSEVVGKSIQAVLAAPDSTMLPPGASLDPSAESLWKAASAQSAAHAFPAAQSQLKRLAGTVRLTTYAGLRINRTIAIMLIREGITIVSCSNIAIAFKSIDSDEDIAGMIATFYESRVASALDAADTDTLGSRLKFIDLLPPRIQHEAIIDAFTDLRGAIDVLRRGVSFAP